MNVHEFDYKVGFGYTKVNIITLADQHHGAATHDKKLFASCIKYIKSVENPIVLMPGDTTDDDRPSTRERRKQMYSDRPEAFTYEDKQHMAFLDKDVIPLYEPIAGYIKSVLDGDHFRVYQNGLTSTQYMCNKLKIHYLGERMGFCRILFHTPNKKQKHLFTIHMMHGQGSASTQGGDINSLINQTAGFDADLCIAGHTHKAMPCKLPIIYVDQNGNIKERIRTYVRSGSFLKSYVEGTQTYAEKAGYRPLSTGFSVVTLTLGRNASNNNSLGVVDVKVTI